MVDDIYVCNGIRVTAETNGFCGGDGGHGCKTKIGIEDLAGTDLRATSDEKGFTLEVYGDSELSTLYEAISFIKHALEYYEPQLKGEGKK